MKNNNKSKIFNVITPVLKYAGITLLLGGLVAGGVVMGTVALNVGIITMFAMLGFGAASLVSYNICKVYRDGYNAEKQEQNQKEYEYSKLNKVYETEHECKMDNTKQNDDLKTYVEYKDTEIDKGM